MTSKASTEPLVQDNCPIVQIKDLSAFHANQSMTGLNQNPTRSMTAGKLFDSCITKNELAQHLKVSVSLINRLMAEDGLPHVKIGRAVRFRLDDIYAWFQRKGMKL
jgi:excisionase family DNA binding protein